MRRYVFTLPAMFLACACLAMTPQKPTGLGDTASLRIGESFVVTGENLTILFERVAEDSRCPTGVTCVWEGDGIVKLTASKDGQSTSLDLHTHPNFARDGSASGYRIQLVGLAPLPQANRRVESGEYVATIVVTKS